MNIFDGIRLANLGLKLRSMWSGLSKSNPITPKKIVCTMKLIYQFFGGTLVVGGVLTGLFYLAPCGPAVPPPVEAKQTYALLPEPTQVLPANVAEPAPVKAPERTVLKTINSPTVNDYDVRVLVNEHGGMTDKGSGTLYRSNAIVTAFHVVRDQPNAPIAIRFPDGTKVKGHVFEADKNYDIAVITLEDPVDYAPAILSTTKDLTHLECHGFGQDETYRCVSGKFDSWGAIDRNPNKSTLNIGVGVREGDSGGGIFNSDGLYGVIWGSKDNVTRGTSGAGFRAILGRINKHLDDQPDKLVVHSMELSQCPPCRIMAGIVKQLKENGYNADDIIDANPDGPRPRLDFYRGERLVGSHQGALEYNVIAGTLSRKPNAANQSRSN